MEEDHNPEGANGWGIEPARTRRWDLARGSGVGRAMD